MNARPDAGGGGVALFGCGRMGRVHGQALRSLGLSATDLCDLDEERLREAGEALGVAPDRRFRDPRSLVDACPSLRLAVVATTADSHAELVLLLAAAGASMVLSEKPMATSVADCDRMIEACAASGTRLAINHQMRFMPQYTLIKEEFERGNLGTLSSMNVVGGSFGLASNGTHYLEAFSYLTGSRPRSVAGWFSPGEVPSPRGPRFFDRAGQIRVTSEAGHRLHLEAGADQGHGMTVLYATRWGHVFVDELQGEFTATARKPEHRQLPASRYGMPWDRWRREFPPADNLAPTLEVLRALVEGRDHPDGRAGRSAVAVLAAAHRSASEGNREVEIEDLGDFHERRFPWA